jgi:hypothetical protein
VAEALCGLPRLQSVWLPTYAPWLNPIEKLWRWLRQDVLKMHVWPVTLPGFGSGCVRFWISLSMVQKPCSGTWD